MPPRRTHSAKAAKPKSRAKPKPKPVPAVLYHGTSVDGFAFGRGSELYLTDDIEMAATYAVNKFTEDGTAPMVYVVAFAEQLQPLMNEGVVDLKPDEDFTGSKSWRVSLRAHHSVVAYGNTQQLKQVMQVAPDAATAIASEAAAMNVQLPAAKA